MSDESEMPAELQATPTNVQVAVRCRPLNAREKAAGRGAVLQCRQNAHEVAVAKRKTYTFDRVFGQYSTQKDVFSSVVRPAVDEALAGYNCTVFAYGQTGTGKTYTMQGDLTPGSETAGIIPRSVRCIFDALEAKGEEFSVRVSFLQLYNEELKDLLDPDGDKKLRLMEDAKRGGIYCMNLLEVTATTAKHVFELVNTGVKNRITSETLMNENSSRSHSIFTIRIHSKEHNAAGEDLLRVGQLNLVDLAGSECVGRSGARNARAREAGTINQSLLTLGRVITALVDNLPHVPYRDSKLTRLLQESLGGRAKTTIIATLAPCADSLDETLSTLEYAFRAKHIKNKPELNQKMTKAGLLNDFGSEIETLREALRAARLKDGVYLPLEQFTDMQERLSGQGVQVTELEEMLKARNDMCKELEERVEKHAAELAALNQERQEVSNRLAATENKLASTEDTLAKTTAELKRVQVLLKSFQDNEQVLLANGATATKLFDASERRATQLLEKIEKTQQVEVTNTELASSYHNESKSRINSFMERLTKHKEDQDNVFNDVSDALRKLQTAHSTDVEALVTNLNALQSLVDSRKALSAKTIAEEKSQKYEQRGMMTKSMNERQNAIDAKLGKFVELSKRQAAAIAEDLAATKTRNVSFVENVQTMLAGSREELRSFLSEQSDKLLELQVAVDMSIEKQTKQLDENKANLVEALKSGHEKQQQELNDVKVQLAEYVDRCIQNQAQKLSEQQQLIEENVVIQKKELGFVQTITKQEVKNFVQVLGQQKAKHEDETTSLRKHLDEMSGLLNDSNVRQTELVQSQEQARSEWSSGIATLTKKNTDGMTELMEQHSRADDETFRKRQHQLTKFMTDHEDLRKLITGSCNKLEQGLQSHLVDTADKAKSASALCEQFSGEAKEMSTEQLERMESYMKKRRINARTGATPMKKDNRPFPSFQPTKIDDKNLTQSLLCGSPSGHKRRRLSDASADDNVVAKDILKLAPVPTAETMTSETSKIQNAAPVAPAQETAPIVVADVKTSTSSCPKPATHSVSKVRKAGVAATLKKSTITHPHRSTKISAAGVRKTTKLSALAAPKRYKAKSPLGESTNVR